MADEAAVADIALMARVRLGDERAFEELHRRYQRRVLAFFYGMAGDGHAANDLCQETFLRVWKVRRRYRATGSFPGYLFGIARLIWLERCREWRKALRLGQATSFDDAWATLSDPGAHPDDRAARSETATEIRRALESLPEEQRIVFVMRTIRGLSLEDIAAALDCPINTVRSRKILAVKKLRHALAHLVPGPVGARY
ncbi:MAG TPA: sigma-70 family RNA polymerase sigma factor [Candidatus Hydrogenedentes bacterium]|nr:sigma-70 family RNA polymerase sigma factor [Candidatus Hydrogenedentota bacterium]HNT90016.1 sigma-70 family RNA polymerase sigma factor [Candidatus Hydrogenedentota bacterium]